MLRLEDIKELENGAQKLTSEISAVERQLFEVTPSGRNFEVKIEKDRELALALERADGHTVSLNILLPENAQFFVGSGLWCADGFFGNRFVTFSPEKLQYRGGLLSLAHEIGHAHQLPMRTLLPAEYNNWEKQEKFHRVLGITAQKKEAPGRLQCAHLGVYKRTDSMYLLDFTTEKKSGNSSCAISLATSFGEDHLFLSLAGRPP